MLLSSCESALLANKAFAPFCFQLIAEKLLDVDASGSGEQCEVEQQLRICEFLVSTAFYYVAPRVVCGKFTSKFNGKKSIAKLW